MAIGDSNYSNNGNFNNGEGGNGGAKKLFDQTFYSRLSIKDPDKKSLTISFRSGLLIISIDQILEGFKHDTVETIYLSPNKALLFKEELARFMKYYTEGNIEENKAFGVNAGMSEKVSYIGISATADKRIVLTIGKFDNSGKIIESASVNLNINYHFALEWNDINTMEDVQKVYDDLLEVKQLYTLCDEFYKGMTGAAGYAAFDTGRYEINRISRKMDPIYDKLGIERIRSNNNYSNRQQNNFLNNMSGNTSAKSVSLGDVEDSIDDMMGE